MAKQDRKASTQNGKEKLKWETARELGLDDDLAAGGDELSVKEAGKIGGQMVKKLIAEGEKQIVQEDSGEGNA
ncbi:MAG TPA: alpha/beta-type small acid-soluble spore protein [Bacillota bacterium]